jgi:hypothetical protein
MMRSPLILRAGAVTALAIGALLVASPGQASTSTTVTLSGGSLSLTDPASANIGSAVSSPTGTSVSGHLGTTTVTDSRGSIAGWTVTISSTSFSDGATPTPHTIAAGKFRTYIAAGDGPTVAAGIAVPVTSYTTSGTALTLSNSGQTLLTATATGSNTVTYNPTIMATLDSTVIAGTYTGTITQTVA